VRVTFCASRNPTKTAKAIGGAEGWGYWEHERAIRSFEGREDASRKTPRETRAGAGGGGEGEGKIGRLHGWTGGELKR